MADTTKHYFTVLFLSFKILSLSMTKWCFSQFVSYFLLFIVSSVLLMISHFTIPPTKQLIYSWTFLSCSFDLNLTPLFLFLYFKSLLRHFILFVICLSYLSLWFILFLYLFCFILIESSIVLSTYVNVIIKIGTETYKIWKF